ncbi:MAG: polysaccharide deacetylase family protein [Clostridia bacterium]|nr:polysaccharide deacetylase family protein [Clostridia bacterium]
MFLYDIARKINHKRKLRQKELAGLYLSPVRRIERVAPSSKGRYVAMTFDDGPSALPPNPLTKIEYAHEGLTDILLDILGRYDAKGTFDVIGTTEYNYPDKAGKVNYFSWGGMKFDHYPDFKKDSSGGVKNQLETARRMISEGHELSNHGYRHVLFGPMKIVYGRRAYYKNLQEVIDDLSVLHDYVLTELNYEMKLSRPPHYIDRILGGHSSYDVYKYMGYQYLAASFDGGGWKPSSGNYKTDVDMMVKPLEQALLSDPDILNGQIIFQKDGCNMSRQTPVADALDEHLRLLSQAGYKIITASELLKISPFSDIGDKDPAFEYVQHLAILGHCIGYKNNTFQPDRILTNGELAVMLTPPEVLNKIHREQYDQNSKEHPYYKVIMLASKQSWFRKTWGSKGDFMVNEPVSVKGFEKFLNCISDGEDIDWTPSFHNGYLKRRDVMSCLAGLTNKAVYNKLYV